MVARIQTNRSVSDEACERPSVAGDTDIRTNADEEASPVVQSRKCSYHTAAPGPVVVEITHLSISSSNSQRHRGHLKVLVQIKRNGKLTGTPRSARVQ